MAQLVSEHWIRRRRTRFGRGVLYGSGASGREAEEKQLICETAELKRASVRLETERLEACWPETGRPGIDKADRLRKSQAGKRRQGREAFPNPAESLPAAAKFKKSGGAFRS